MPMIFVNGNDGGTILPAPPGTCPVCAKTHDPLMPHDAQSLHYQYKFRQKRGRWPTWKDALAHCGANMRTVWEAELKHRGVWTEPATTEEEAVLTEIEGKPVIRELPPGAPVPPLMKVTTVKIRERKKRRAGKR